MNEYPGKIEFPKYMYHADGAVILVHNMADFDAAVGDGYAEAPIPNPDFVPLVGGLHWKQTAELPEDEIVKVKRLPRRK